MPGKNSDHVRLGLFVLLGTAVLIIGLYLLGNKRAMFSSTVSLRTTFQQVGGLRAGNNVRYAGIDVGTVEEIRIVNDKTVMVIMAIREQDVAHIRDNAIASLGSDGLMGNKLVNIGPGEGLGLVVVEGTTLRSSVPLDTDLMMRTLDRTNINMAEITDDLRELSERINRPGGLVSLLSDSVLAGQVRGSLADLESAATHVRAAAARADAMIADVHAGKGALGTLVGDPEAEQQVRQWLATMTRMADTLAHASAQVDDFAMGLNDPGGLGYAITRDTAVAGDVRRTLQRLEQSSVTLDEDLKALQRNWFFRKYFKEKEKAKGK